MGWADCGTDSKGRHIGYAFSATCDHPECAVEIDRGLGYACGGMHGEDATPHSDADVCEQYFCSAHLASMVEVNAQPERLPDTAWVSVCDACAKRAPKCGACGQGSFALVDGVCGDCR